jgi:hypothetical protein
MQQPTTVHWQVQKYKARQVASNILARLAAGTAKQSALPKLVPNV